MRYARLTRDNTIASFMEFTEAEYSALSTLDKASLYEAPEPVDETYIFEDRWYSLEEIRDREFTANPDAYKEIRTETINSYRAGIFKAGFTYEGNLFKGEANDQLWMNAFLELLSSGITAPPIHWITMSNDVVVFNTIEEFRALAGVFFQWAQQTTFNLLQVKQQIRDAGTRVEVDAAYDPFVANMESQGITIGE